MIQLTNEYLDSVWWKYIEAPDVVMAMGKEGFRSAVKEILSKNITLSPISVEGKDQLKDMKEFFNKHKGIPLND